MYFYGNYPKSSRTMLFYSVVTVRHGISQRLFMVPDNIVLFFIPPYTPEMNPIEQIWKELRKRGFKSEVFSSLEKVVDRLCDAICSLTPTIIHSITGREWIIKCFNK